MRGYVIGIGLIVLAVAAFQGESVGNGLLLDDYDRRVGLREGDWSFGSMVKVSGLGSDRRHVEMWWQPDVEIRYFRPLGFLIYRVIYVLAGWRPEVMHVVSLGWEVLCASLVLVLARQVTGSAWWAALAGVLFALHPTDYQVMRWIDCQHLQMAMASLMCGLLFYGEYSEWFPGGEPAAPARGYLLAAIAFFVMALGCYESTIVFGGMVVVGDWLVRPRRCKGRWGGYGAILGVTVAYLAIRYVALGGFPMPGLPHVYPPGEPGFVRFIVDKFIYYVLGLFLYVPIVGFAGLPVLRAHPLPFYGGFAALVLVAGLVLWWLRERRCIRLWVAIALIAMVPALQVFASPHHLFIASAAMVIAMVAVWQGLMEWGARRATRLGKAVRLAVGGLIVVHLGAFGAASYYYGNVMAALSAVGQLPVDDVVRFSDELTPHDKLFFVNLPLLGFNCVPGIEEAAGTSPLKGYVLTFSPDFLRMDRPGYVERVGQSQLRVWLDKDGYFSGTPGERLLTAAGREAPFGVGESFSTDDFTVEVVRSSNSGVGELLFTFQRPLDDPTYHFFFGSRAHFAYPLRFPVSREARGSATP
ncbi:MAG: hypothetical protein JXQ73_09215 [Phycisphaerae bacterium]|nr:hypothetical protein [Phycisphaerae bacterium]